MDLQNRKTSTRPSYDVLCELCRRFVDEFAILGRPQSWEPGRSSNNFVDVRVDVDTGSQFPVCKHHGQLGALKRSARNGCHLCSLLDAFDPEAAFTYDDTSTTPYVLYLDGWEDRGAQCQIVLCADDCLEKVVYATWAVDRQDAPTLRFLRTDASEVLALGKTWLNTCLTTHAKCRARGDTGLHFVPSRLIRIKASGVVVEKAILSVGNSCSSPRYLTLSHCWGGANIVKLTKATLVPFQSHLPMANFPNTFKDALKITAALGYEYIWIDSLCIIQDSAEDWEEQAKQMSSVYLHSDCTIAALGAKDSHGGCFHVRSVLSFTPCRIQSDQNLPFYVEGPSTQYEPLHIRAWVVQERCLSRRTLNFGINYISWECIEAEASESKPGMDERNAVDSLKDIYGQLLAFENYKGNDSRKMQEWFRLWWEVVYEYTKCHLTYKTDRWPAIYAMASEVQARCIVRDTFLIHGLWYHALPSELLWFTEDRGERLLNGSPSWSWLSIDGGVSKHRCPVREVEFKVDYPQEVLNSGNLLPCSLEFGNRHLHITACCQKVTWVKSAYRGSDEFYEYSLRLHNHEERHARYAKQCYWLPDIEPNPEWDTWAMHVYLTTENESALITESVGLIIAPAIDIPQDVQDYHSAKESTSEVSKARYSDFWRRVGYYTIRWHWNTKQNKSISKAVCYKALDQLGFEREMSICLV